MKLKLAFGSFDDKNHILTALLCGTSRLVIRRGHWKKKPFAIFVTAWREEGGFLQQAGAFAFTGHHFCCPDPEVPYCVLTARASEDKGGEKDLMAAAFAVMRRRVIASIKATGGK
jgi:hypothetical protein